MVRAVMAVVMAEVRGVNATSPCTLSQLERVVIVVIANAEFWKREQRP